MQKCVAIFDLDGVVVKKNEVFSIRFSKKHGIPLDKILEFFKGEFQDCLIGKKDLVHILPGWLEKWGVKDPVDEVIEFWFAGEADVDREVVRQVEKIKSKVMGVYAVTNNEKHRVEYLKEKTIIDSYFDRLFSSADVGLKKPDVDFYKKIQELIEVRDPGKIWFWDDDVENVEGAKKAGWNAKLFLDSRDILM